MTMTLVETIEVGSGGAASIEFTSIPQDADDLLLVMSIRHATNTSGSTQFQINGSGGSLRQLRGSGSSVLSATSGSLFAFVTNSDNTSNTFASTSLYIPNYTTSAAHSISIDNVTENNATAAFQALIAGITTSTAAVTSILIGGTYDQVQYSSASLYKITKA